MKRLHRYSGAKSFSDLKTIVLDSLLMSSSMVCQPNFAISGLRYPLIKFFLFFLKSLAIKLANFSVISFSKVKYKVVLFVLRLSHIG